MTDRDIPISRCSLKGMFGTFMEDVVFDKRVTTGEESLGGSGGYVAQRGTADYNIRATIGSIAGAINGVLDVGEDAVRCAERGHPSTKKSIDDGAKRVRAFMRDYFFQ